MGDEATLHESAHAVVTTARAMIGGTTYPVSGITAVSLAVIPANRNAGLALALGGLITAGCCGLPNITRFEEYPIAVFLGLLGLLVMPLGFVAAGTATAKYAVVLGTAGGERRALVTNQKSVAHDIVVALNEAIVRRG